MSYHDVKEWRLWGLLTPTRTIGEVRLNKNGSFIDFWLRDKDGTLKWYGIREKDLRDFLESNKKSIKLTVYSDGQLKAKVIELKVKGDKA